MAHRAILVLSFVASQVRTEGFEASYCVSAPSIALSAASNAVYLQLEYIS